VVCRRRDMREVASSRRPFDYIFSHLRHAEQPDSVSGSYGDVIGHTFDLDQGPHDKAMRSHSLYYKRWEVFLRLRKAYCALNVDIMTDYAERFVVCNGWNSG
jgi:hypothetical protein